jgi:hypothetical protein
MINFPINPNIGLEYTDQNTGITWVWTGETWDFVCDVEGSTPLPTTTYIGINPIDVSVFVDQLGNKTVTVSHLESGVIPGSYNRVVVDQYGHIISATNERSGHIIQDTGVNMPDRLHLDFRRMIVRDNPLLNSTEVIRPPSVFVGTDPPTYELLPGDEWIDSSTWKKYIWYEGYWVETGKVDCNNYINEITPSSTFLQLFDTPSSYVGSEGYVVTVNGTANGLTFVPASFDSGFDIPPVHISYQSTIDMVLGQSTHVSGYIYYDGKDYWEYLGGRESTILNYRKISQDGIQNIDGGFANSTYLLQQNISGGGA